MAATLTPKRYAPEIEGIEFGDMDAAVTGQDLDAREWLSALGEIASAHQATAWWLGDLLAYGEDMKMSYAEAAEATGYAVGSLRNMASISRQVSPEVRRPGIHWRTHKVVAPLADPDEQSRWLELAEIKGMTSDDLALAIKSEQRAGGGLEDAEGGECVCPKCGGSGTVTEGSKS